MISRRLFLATSASVLAAPLTGTAGAAPDARALVDVSRKAQRVELTANSQMVLMDAGGKQRVRKMELKVKNIAGRWCSYLKFTFPPDIAGTQFLVLENAGSAENDMFLYQPITKRTRRITAGQRTGRFLGTDFLFEDLDLRDVDEESHSFLRNEDLKLVAGKVTQVIPCAVVESRPLPAANSAYSKIVSWLDAKTNYARQVELHSGDRLAKRFSVYKLDTTKHRPVPMLSQMEDLQAGSRTILQTERYSLDRDAIPDEIFSESYLLGGV